MCGNMICVDADPSLKDNLSRIDICSNRALWPEKADIRKIQQRKVQQRQTRPGCTLIQHVDQISMPRSVPTTQHMMSGATGHIKQQGCPEQSLCTMWIPPADQNMMCLFLEGVHVQNRASA